MTPSIRKVFTLTIITLAMFFITYQDVFAQSSPAANDALHIQSVEFDDDAPLTEPAVPVAKSKTPEKPYEILFDPIKKGVKPFTFSLSDRLLDFGELSPSNPINRSVQIGIYNSTPFSYAIVALEDHPLEQAQGMTIPDTTCDNGSCSQSVASSWTSGLTYGFGFRCNNTAGLDCSSDFSDTGTFRQFSDASLQEDPAVIMAGGGNKKNAQASISMQINVPGSQPPGSYATAITFLATPGF